MSVFFRFAFRLQLSAELVMFVAYDDMALIRLFALLALRPEIVV